MREEKEEYWPAGRGDAACFFFNFHPGSSRSTLTGRIFGSRRWRISGLSVARDDAIYQTTSVSDII
jgi:glucose/arabinose dehydrogenase